MKWRFWRGSNGVTHETFGIAGRRSMTLCENVEMRMLYDADTLKRGKKPVTCVICVAEGIRRKARRAHELA
jgi:hypothetical protein